MELVLSFYKTLQVTFELLNKEKQNTHPILLEIELSWLPYTTYFIYFTIKMKLCLGIGKSEFNLRLHFAKSSHLSFRVAYILCTLLIQTQVSVLLLFSLESKSCFASLTPDIITVL